MENIHLTVLFETENYGYGKTSPENYKEMLVLCRQSFKQNLIELDRQITINIKANNYDDGSKKLFHQIREIHSECECNILYTDADVLCVWPISVFGKLNEFRMFSFTNSKRYWSSYPQDVPGEYYKNLLPWGFSNIRYYPAGLKESVWDCGMSFINKWINVWAYECIIYNQMFHCQNLGRDITKLHMPEYNYQMFDNYPNGISELDAHVLHFSGTRGSKTALQKMRSFTV